jgi:VWFA-related protein
MRKHARVLSLVLIFLFLLTPTIGRAQTSISLHIVSVDAKEEADHMVLSVYFTLVDDATGKPISESPAKVAKITDIDTNNSVTANIEKAQNPLFIGLLLDTSSSMANSAADMKKAAADSLKDPPPTAQFAIMQFNDDWSIVHDYTTNVDVAALAISKIVIQANKGTCLYDAVWQEIDYLSKSPAGRRAIILFTDGRDEPRTGGGLCSKHGYDQIVAFAMQPQSRVPINTIGLSGVNKNINAAELQNMASTTGGFSAIGNQEQLSALFTIIMDGLASQLQAVGDFYPTKGKHNAVLQVTLPDGTPLTATVPFESSKDYYVPPDPVNISVEGVEYNPINKNYQISLTVVSPQLIDTLKVSIWDTKNGIKVVERAFQNLNAKPAFAMPADGLTATHEYEIHFDPLDANGSPVKNAKGEPIQVVHSFTFDPNTVNTKINVTSVAIVSQQLVVKLTVDNSNLVGKYEGWLKDESTNSQIPASVFSMAALPSDSTLNLPLQDIRSGKYTLVLRALNKENQELTVTEYPGIVYTAPAAMSVSSLQRIAVALISHPWILGIIVLMFLAVAGFLAWAIRRSLRQTGTPVLQGQIETVLDGQNSSLPINQTVKFDVRKMGVPGARPAGVSSGAPAKTPPPAQPRTPPAPAPRTPPVAPPAVPPQAAVSNNAATRVVSRPPGQASQPQRVQLRVYRSTDPALLGKTILVTPLPFFIGSRDSHLMVGGDSPTAGRFAQISYDPLKKGYMIVDLQSPTGVWLNGVRIAPSLPASLLPGMMIALGKDIQLLFG